MEGMKAEIKEMLLGIERYNPDKVPTLEHYVNLQSRERGYDLEANLALLKLYQFMPELYKLDVVAQILLLSLTNLPHNDIVLCKAMLSQEVLEDQKIGTILYLSELLEMCQFKTFWKEINKHHTLTGMVTGFEDSVRKFVCHVISITYQTIEDTVLRELLGLVDENAIRKWTDMYGWSLGEDGVVYLASQEEIIKTRNITEKIDLESVAGIMASCF
jgi:translation initiation factor 3 subunit K